MFWTHVFNYHSEHANRFENKTIFKLKEQQTIKSLNYSELLTSYFSTEVLLKRNPFIFASLYIALNIPYSILFFQTSERKKNQNHWPLNTRTIWQFHNQKNCSYLPWENSWMTFCARRDTDTFSLFYNHIKKKQIKPKLNNHKKKMFHFFL